MSDLKYDRPGGLVCQSSRPAACHAKTSTLRMDQNVPLRVHLANHIVFSVSFGYRNPTDMSGGGNEPTDLQKRVHEIIFEADTPAGKQFDVLLIICILLSVGATMIETIPRIHPNQRDLLNTLEWAFTIGFTLEYFVRLWV